MDIAISGASGLIGTALSQSLSANGHRPIALVRRSPRPGADEIRWNPSGGEIDADSLDGIEAVIHLAGAGIADKRWTDERKELILDSRVEGTSLLAISLAGLNRPPSVFVSGSAIGYYGDRGDEVLSESSTRGAGFLADVVVEWETAATPAREAGIRTPLARTGIVLSDHGGVLAKQLPLFKVGLGGRFGSGDQWMSWITLHDQVRALEFLLTAPIDGPVNLTAPNPATNSAFTKALGAELNRPTVLPVPLIGPRLLFGKQLVDELILASQRIEPRVLASHGFTFDHETLATGLSSILGK